MKSRPRLLSLSYELDGVFAQLTAPSIGYRFFQRQNVRATTPGRQTSLPMGAAFAFLNEPICLGLKSLTFSRFEKIAGN
jgi:hypothetical protein